MLCLAPGETRELILKDAAAKTIRMSVTNTSESVKSVSTLRVQILGGDVREYEVVGEVLQKFLEAAE